jgi:hypothetical protein
VFGFQPHWHGCPAARLASLLMLFLFVVSSSSARAEFREGFEGPETSWRLADRDCTVQIITHARRFERAHSGHGCEQLQIRATDGSFVHFAHAIPPSRIIDELNAGVWVRSDRPGIQLMVRVVLPRSIDPRTGQPLKTLLRGNSYHDVDSWQKLTVDRPHQRLTEQLPLLRSQFGSDVSRREAFADLIVLNTYGGKGTTSLSIDDLEILGQVSTDDAAPAETDANRDMADQAPQFPATASNQQMVQLVGSQLLIDGRPQLPRIIEHNGEPLAWLKSRGFNAIRVAQEASEELLQEAEATGVWVVAPPTLDLAPEQNRRLPSSLLAWNLGEQLTAGDYESVRRAGQRLRGQYGKATPVLFCAPTSDFQRYSRATDLLLLTPPALSGSLPLQDLGKWYLRKRRLARERTLFWASVETQLSPQATQQIRAAGAVLETPISLEPEQMRLATYHAIASGACGIIFRSQSPLNATDRLSVIRAESLQKLNQELALLEPWATTKIHEEELECQDPTFRISMLATERSRLVLIIRRMADQQFVAGRVDPKVVSFAVHGATETDEVYHIAADGLHRIQQQRGTGMKISLNTTDTVTPVVLTQDRLTINYLARQLAENRNQHDLLEAEIAANVYASVVETHQRLLGLEPAVGGANDSLEQARGQLQLYEQLIEGGGHDRAHKYLACGLRQLAMARYEVWRTAVDAFSSRVTSPFCLSYFSLPYHYELARRLQHAPWSPNILAGGDFESLDHLQANDWKHMTHSGDAETAVELSLHAPHSGRSSLRLQCWPSNSDSPARVLDATPVSIVSSPVPVSAGQILRIRGMARVPETILGSLDGLLIYDSLGGPNLAHRITHTNGWQEFVLYRTAVEDGAVTLTFALRGYGEAWLDNISIEKVELPRGPMVQRSGRSRQ